MGAIMDATPADGNKYHYVIRLSTIVAAIGLGSSLAVFFLDKYLNNGILYMSVEERNKFIREK